MQPEPTFEMVAFFARGPHGPFPRCLQKHKTEGILYVKDKTRGAISRRNHLSSFKSAKLEANSRCISNTWLLLNKVKMVSWDSSAHVTLPLSVFLFLLKLEKQEVEK